MNLIVTIVSLIICGGFTAGTAMARGLRGFTQSTDGLAVAVFYGSLTHGSIDKVH